MASFSASGAGDRASSPAPAIDLHHDPFVRVATPLSHQRFSNFDSQHFAFGPNASPAQAKRALEAHLAETNRRMEEAGKLGTALLQQRQEINDRLKEIENLEGEGGLSDDLRQKLVEIEKDYNEVARESARAFLPKQRVPSNEAAAGSPFVPEGKSGRRSVSPSKFEAQATGSPIKFGVPNRKLRNQQTNRIHDIEFAAEISTSLIGQVRNLQDLLAKKEEELKEVKIEKSKLEYEAEGFQQRVKNLDESEHRYKDENWNLETQIHDLLAKERESADREKKLTQTLNVLQAEKNSAQRELDELKLNHSKLSEEYAAATKHHDIELGTAKRNIVIADSERSALRKKIDDLTGQNTELAKAVSASQRARIIERESILGMSDEDFETAHDKTTPEHSPPPSPVKGTPRHSMLESETLKTSLGHAQRTIQGLRNNVHREKTEKLELKRMLQEARDELEKLRHDPLAQNKRARKTDSKEFKKPLKLLGNLRSSRSEIFSEDSNWEDQPESTSPARSSLASRGSSQFQSVVEEPIEQFETANETSDAAFETANEPATETDDFHTGAEEFSSDDDAETETDSPSKRRTPRHRPSLPMGLTRSSSMHSTASTEDEDYPFDHELRTPTSLPPPQHKFQVRVSRGALRRPRQLSEEPSFHSSPPSIASSSVAGTPQPIQSLAAELGDFDASDNESNLSATPSRRSIRGRTVSPPPPVPPLPPRVTMVDTGTMTDELPDPHGAARPMSLDTVVSGFSSSSYDSVGHDLEDNLSKFPSPPTSPPKEPDFIPELEFSSVHAHGIKPISMPDTRAAEHAALQNEHEKHLKDISDEKAAAYAAALEELKSQHEEQLNSVQAEANLAHTEEVESLKSNHANEISKTVADVRAAHAQELDTLRSNHADEVNRAVASTQAAYEEELESLRSAHAEEISKAITDVHVSHTKELEALQSSHSDEVAKAVSMIQSAHARELEMLQSSHAEEINKALAETRAAHAQELEELRSSFAEQADKVAAENQAAHSQELDALEAALAEQISQKDLESKAARDSEFEALRSSHAEQIAARESEIKAAHAAELETLKAKHGDELNNLKKDNDARHAAEIAALVAAHSSQVNQLKTELFDAHAKEIQSLQTEYAQSLENAKQQSDAAHSEELNALRTSHSQQVDDLKNTLTAAHAEELASVQAVHAKHVEDLKKDSDAQRAAEIAALIASHGKQLESARAESEATLSKELAALKEAHAQEIDTLNSQHSATRAQELETFQAAIDKQIQSTKTEGDAAHTQQIDALNAAHTEVLEAQKRDSEKSQLQALESLRAAHERNIEALKSENSVTRAKELDNITTAHLEELTALRRDLEASEAKALEDLTVAHSQQLNILHQSHLEELAALSSGHESAKAKLVEELTNSHARELEDLRQDIESSKAAEIAALSVNHAKDLDAVKNEHETAMSLKLKELSDAHSRELDSLREESGKTKSEALAVLVGTHATEIDNLRTEHEALQSQKLQELADNHSRELESHRQESDNTKSEALATLAATHANELEVLKNESEAAHAQDLEQLKAAHAEALETLQATHESILTSSLESLKDDHATAVAELHKQRDLDQAQALEALQTSHSQHIAKLQQDADAALARKIEVVKTEHAAVLESYDTENAAEKERLLADHAAELEALRKSLEVAPPSLGLSSLSSIELEPVEVPELRSPRRDAFIIPREGLPQTPASTRLGLGGRKGDKVPSLEIAEDETRQSPSATPGPETPESQLPFKEISANAGARPSQKPATHTSNQSSQTALTSDELDRLLKHQGRDSVTITTARGEVTVTPFDEAQATQRVDEAGAISAPESIPIRRPGSSASTRGTNPTMPPLPPNHREAIEAARTNSAGGGRGTMGPPLIPASAYRAPTSRPETPSNVRPMSPTSVRGTPTPRAGRALPGHADVHSPTRIPFHSRKSSVSSFASEIDTRFNIRGEMSADAGGFGPNTDPRMIQAITQTMIGEYLWKYTRKTGRGEMSENRHRRYFWVHPYTKTLYWSDRDPSTAGRSELKAKSIPIEAVRVVGDDNPMPPGLHRKSLIIISPGRTVKFTCTTGQRHETWFNALSYLLLRTGNENQTDTEEVAGQITQEDVDEFNPSINHRPVNGNRARAPPSLSSYNSRATHNSPTVEVNLSIPTLTPTREREANRSTGTLGRLSGYWKSSTINSTFSSLRSRSHLPQDSAIYEASEVPDSAEDLRRIIEEQDQAADRLENVRACCDGNTGLGLEIVKALYATDVPYEIIIGCRTVSKGEDAIATVQKETPSQSSSPSSISVVQVDLSSDASLEAAVETIRSRHGRLDVLVNNAGAGFDQEARAGRMTLREAWNATWDTNVSGTHVLTTLAAPLLLQSQSQSQSQSSSSSKDGDGEGAGAGAGARILFVTSGTANLTDTESTANPMLARLNGSPPAGWPKQLDGAGVVFPAYRSAKTGLNMVMREWHRVLKNDGVKVWCISPGALATGLGGIGADKMRQLGALHPSVGGQLIRDVVQGKRDADVGKVVRSNGVQPW
ncbi:hypothetical protein Hte_008565 [Hypoxylon texense]